VPMSPTPIVRIRQLPQLRPGPAPAAIRIFHMRHGLEYLFYS
jgi:hypothetical protein